MVGRRRVRVEDSSAWVFNRMAHVYAARPAYPEAVVDALCALVGEARAHALDIGAGIGHLALPLSARGLQVTAVEPAQAMLSELESAARSAQLALDCQLATAEALPLGDASVDLVVIADALHFMDAALTGQEVARVLRPKGAVAIVRVELADTPFMRELVAIMEESAPRRPRAVAKATLQVLALAKVSAREEQTFLDEVRVDHATLERILRSISFIGPAMNADRFAAFRARVLSLSAEPVWSRRITLCAGVRD
jgi:ubiquinone/menaquinone biosynthesis C-methylase UbiE